MKVSLGIGIGKAFKVLGTGAKANAEYKATIEVNTDKGIKVTTGVEASLKGQALNGKELGPSPGISETQVTVHPDATMTGQEKPVINTSISLSGKESGPSVSNSNELTVFQGEDTTIVPVPVAEGVALPVPLTEGAEVTIDLDKLFDAVFSLFWDEDDKKSDGKKTTKHKADKRDDRDKKP